MNRDLLVAFVRAYPAQPATAIWRAIEVEAIRRHGLPEGLGLDVGCGDGKLTRIILGLVGRRDLVGIDPDQLETRAARASGIYRSVHTSSAARVPWPDASFDFALSNSVLEHIPDLGPTLAEVARVLRPGATFVITVPTVGFHRNLQGPGRASGNRDRYLAKLDARLAHHHYLDTPGWRAILADHGMQLERRFGYLDRAECQRWEWLSKMTGGLLYSLAGGQSRPIEIQRKLGLREAQNRAGWPRPVARLMAVALAAGLDATPAYWSTREGLDDLQAGCLLIAARRN
ncbi:MAG TPA: class I SAM-dependent methyltransferase [Steroidobacteraceae bacterium]|nr:class I SAM-dependent methyltransferase [Steroidobacteraceae bacterium]